ncbi:MAG TPA: hypothetical protein VM285_11695 [Polyangia bacterium]|nr:hypothetical protein [Polyangia bacterium]
MPSSSACHSALLVLVFAANAAAQAEGPPVPDATGAERRAGPGSVLVLPTRTPALSTVDGGALDLLLATALQDLAFEVLDPAGVLEAFHRGAPGLEQARAAYLDMRLEDALRLARDERERHLAHRGDLLRDPRLQGAELFMVQVLMDLGREGEATTVAEGILERNPMLRLDPAEYAPQVQALWASVVERRTGNAVGVPAEGELRELAVLLEADWLALAICNGNEAGEPGLLLRLVPADPMEQFSDHRAALETPATWGNAVRGLLLERFPPPAPADATVADGGGPDGPAVPPGDVEAEAPPWYRRWWFWTAVGVVVLGGTAGAVGGYYANKDPGDPRVTADFSW